MSSDSELGLKDKNWRNFSRRYYAADKETGWKMLLDEYYDAKNDMEKYDYVNEDSKTRFENRIKFLTYKNYIEDLGHEILKIVMEENGYK